MFVGGSHSIPGWPQPHTCHLVYIYILKTGGPGEHQYPLGSHLCADHLSFSGRNGTSTCTTCRYSTGQPGTVDATLTVERAWGSGQVPEHCPSSTALSLTALILAFPFSFSSTRKCCVCSHGCFMYCTAPEVLIQNTCRTEPIMLSSFQFALVSLFPF